jgi:hypothetical protein
MEETMALVPLATMGNYLHVYDFKVKSGTGDKFIELFNAFDYGPDNPFHKSDAQIKDGVLCRDTEDPDHFYLIAEWANIDAHIAIRKVAASMAPEFVRLVEGGKFVPTYAKVVSSTPQHLLDEAAG